MLLYLNFSTLGLNSYVAFQVYLEGLVKLMLLL